MTRRDDLAAIVAVVAFLAQLIFAQCTVALVICLVIVGRMSRWRPLWLAAPAAAGLGWMFVIGVRPAVAGYLAGGSQVLALVAHGSLGGKAKALSDIVATWRLWLPGQVPVALVAAAAQAAILAVLPGRAAIRRPYRPGAVTAARSGYLAAALRRGEVSTCDGCCLGIVPGTGRPAAVSWREAEAGVLCASEDAAAMSAIGRDLALAAIQHRKTVVVIDLAGERAAGLIEPECQAAAAPLRRFDGRNVLYDPLAAARPARGTSLAMAMIDWTGIPHARQLFCANYLNAAFALLAAGRAAQAPMAGTTLDELVRLMRPGALRARLAQVHGSHRAAGPLAAQVAEFSVQLDADGSILAPVASQLAELNSATQAGLRRSADQAPISLAAALADREVVLFPLSRLAPGRPGTMIARLVVADLIEHLADRSDLGSRADCLVWINGCEAIDARQLAVLVALGERTGTAVVLGTAIGAVAAGLAADVNVVAVRGVSPAQLAAPSADQPASQQLGLPDPHHDEMAEVLARLHAQGGREALSFRVLRPRPRLVAGCKVVR